MFSSYHEKLWKQHFICFNLITYSITIPQCYLSFAMHHEAIATVNSNLDLGFLPSPFPGRINNSIKFWIHFASNHEGPSRLAAGNGPANTWQIWLIYRSHGFRSRLTSLIHPGLILVEPVQLARSSLKKKILCLYSLLCWQSLIMRVVSSMLVWWWIPWVIT